MLFIDRDDAGRRLADRLSHLRDQDVVVAGLPRGGVVVAAQVAQALDAPLDVIMVRKLGLPRQPELAMGAIGEGGLRALDHEVVTAAGVQADEIARVEMQERAALDRQGERFRRGRDRVPLEGRTVVIVDDGIATGATARVACAVARARGAVRLVLATPVAPAGWVARLNGVAEEYVALATPARFGGVGRWYEDFAQIGDDEVAAWLESAAAGGTRTAGARSSSARGGDPGRPGEPGQVETYERIPGRDEEVEITAGDVRLAGHLTVPEGAAGLVVFVHGSGSSRHSVRNRHVARVLNSAGLGTLLFDLLTPAEGRDRANVFDVGLLAGRLVEVTGWLRSQPEGRHARLGYFGASTGAAAALWASAEPEVDVSAIVSRGGRPDLAAGRLPAVSAPTLLIVGGEDHLVLALNSEVYEKLRCEADLAVVPGATHLFEEPGTLARAAELASDWFVSHLLPITSEVT